MRELLRREWRALFQRYDILLSPTGAGPAPLIFYDTPIESREDAENRFVGALRDDVDSGTGRHASAVGAVRVHGVGAADGVADHGGPVP